MVEGHLPYRYGNIEMFSSVFFHSFNKVMVTLVKVCENSIQLLFQTSPRARGVGGGGRVIPYNSYTGMRRPTGSHFGSPI